MTVSVALLYVIYLLLGCVVAIVVDAVADIAGMSYRPYRRVPLAIVVVLAWLPLLVIAAVVVTVCLLLLGITRRQ